MEWISVKDRLPDDGIPVKTKIDDKYGARNETILVRKKHMWFLKDLSMYVYYAPTHWMPLPEPPKED